MSQRTYFSFRYAIPGYSFIFIILLINYDFFIVKIIDISKAVPQFVTLFGIIFGFLTVLSGAAIGFLISQSWYFIINIFLKREKISSLRKQYKRFKDILNKFKDISDSHTLLIYFLTSIIDERTTTYINRLNDMFQSLGSTLFAIISGLILGYCLKKETNIQPLFSNTDCLLIKLFIIFIFFIFINLIIVLLEHDSIANLMMEIKGEKFFYDLLKEIKNENLKENII